MIWDDRLEPMANQIMLLQEKIKNKTPAMRTIFWHGCPYYTIVMKFELPNLESNQSNMYVIYSHSNFDTQNKHHLTKLHH
jgi:hypothetical protein